MLELRDYLSLSSADAERQWRFVLDREWMPDRKRQVDFTPIETLLCFGLGLVGNRSKSGNINISETAPPVLKLSELVKRTPASLAAKLANLDGRRPNSAKNERALWAVLTNDLVLFEYLYEIVMDSARWLGIDEERLPDFLGLEAVSLNAVLEADRVSTADLRESVDEQFRDWQALHPGDDVGETERAMVGTARVGQQQFARAVLTNGAYACVFCGLDFRSAGLPSARMLVASHIKPWRLSLNLERVDPLNGLSACPTHDAAFDALLLTILPDLTIVRTPRLQAAIERDPIVARNFGPFGMKDAILLGPSSKPPAVAYLDWHLSAAFQNATQQGDELSVATPHASTEIVEK